MKILLTGATGFIGKNFCDYLNNKKYPVLALSRARNLKKNKNITYLQSSFKLNNQTLKIIKNFQPQVIINLGWYGIPDFSKKNSKKNYMDQKFFFEKIKNIPSIKKIFSFGSCWEYKKKVGKCFETDRFSRDTFFNDSKYKIRVCLENLCKKNKIEFYWLRLFYVYGPYQRKEALLPSLLNSIKKNRKNTVNSIKNTNDFVYVEDVCKLVYKLLVSKTAKGGIYNIGSGKLTGVKKIVKIVYNFYNLKLSVKKIKYNRSIYASIKKIKKVDKFFSPSDLKKSIIKTIKHNA